MLRQRDWLETARRARALTSAPQPHGQRMSAQKAAATELDIGLATLRAYLDGLAIVEEITQRDERLGAVVSTYSIDATRAMGSWLKKKPADALAFLAKTPTASWAAVNRAAKASLAEETNAHLPLWSQLLAQAQKFRLYPLRPFPLIVDRMCNDEDGPDARTLAYEALIAIDLLSVFPPLDEFQQSLGIVQTIYLQASETVLTRFALNEKEFTARRIIEHKDYVSDRGVALASVLSMRNFSVDEMLRRDAKSIQFRAMLAAELFPLVLLPLPSLSAREAFKKGLVPVPGMDVDIQLPDRNTNPEPYDTSNILKLGPHRGVIVIVTPETLLTDIYGVRPSDLDLNADKDRS